MAIIIGEVFGLIVHSSFKVEGEVRRLISKSLNFCVIH
jgi:hypothetical protein